MRALGIISFITSSLLILLFAIIAVKNGKRDPEVSMIPISFLILQTWLSGYYLQRTSKGAIGREDLIVDEPEVFHIKMPRFYKISGVVLAFVLLFAVISIIQVANLAMKGYSSYGKRESVIILAGMVLVSLFIATFNILSSFRIYRISATKEV